MVFPGNAGFTKSDRIWSGKEAWEQGNEEVWPGGDRDEEGTASQSHEC